MLRLSGLLDQHIVDSQTDVLDRLRLNEVRLRLANLTPASGTRRFPLTAVEQRLLLGEMQQVNALLFGFDTPQTINSNVGLRVFAIHVESAYLPNREIYLTIVSPAYSNDRQLSLEFFVHELGHDVVQQTLRRFAADNAPLIQRRLAKTSEQFIDFAMNTHYGESYWELFCDLLVAFHFYHPRTIRHSLDAINPRNEIYNIARDFSAGPEIEGWTHTESHMALFPARRFLGNNYFGNLGGPLNLLERSRILRGVFDAITDELLVPDGEHRSVEVRNRDLFTRIRQRLGPPTGTFVDP